MGVDLAPFHQFGHWKPELLAATKSQQLWFPVAVWPEKVVSRIFKLFQDKTPWVDLASLMGVDLIPFPQFGHQKPELLRVSGSQQLWFPVAIPPENVVSGIFRFQ